MATPQKHIDCHGAIHGTRPHHPLPSLSQANFAKKPFLHDHHCPHTPQRPQPRYRPPQHRSARTAVPRGLLVWKWAPQLEILPHGSTGVFLSHCGWNSVLESLSRGVPVVGWPLAVEQFYNIKMLEEELGVGVELATGEESEVGSGDVERAIRSTSRDNEKGRLMKERAVAVAKTIEDAMRDGDERGSSVKAIDDFLETVVTGRTNSSF